MYLHCFPLNLGHSDRVNDFTKKKKMNKIHGSGTSFADILFLACKTILSCFKPFNQYFISKNLLLCFPHKPLHLQSLTILI